MVGRESTRARKAAMSVAGALIALFFLFPYLQMLLTSLKPKGELTNTPASYLPSEWEWSNFVTLWDRTTVLDYFKSSLIIAGVSTVLVIVVAVPAAYYVSRHRFGWRTVFLLLVVVTQMIQPTSLVVGVLRSFKDLQRWIHLDLIGEYAGLIAVNSAFNLAFAVWILNGFFAAIPHDLEQAAWLDGASKFKAMYKITLPLALPGLVTCIIFTFVSAWNEFAMARALVFGDRKKWPLTLGLSDFVGQYEVDWHYMFATSLIAIVPVVILFASIERFLVKGLTSGAVK
jgi:multiple sugar transport system permease protein